MMPNKKYLLISVAFSILLVLLGYIIYDVFFSSSHQNSEQAISRESIVDSDVHQASIQEVQNKIGQMKSRLQQLKDADTPEYLGLSFAELKQRSSVVDIKIKSFDVTVSEKKYLIQPATVSNQVAMRNWLRNTFKSYIEAKRPGHYLFYIFPRGVGNIIKDLINLSQTTNINQLTENRTKASFVSTDTAVIMALPEVVQVKTFGEIQKEKILLYQRVVDPDIITDSYSFNVKYIPDFDKMMPYQQGSQSIEGKMEGFVSFDSLFSFIEQKQNDWRATRHADGLFLSLRSDPTSWIMLKEANDKIEAVLHSSAPRLDVYVTGDGAELNAVSYIYHPNQLITIADSMQTQ